jgi:hypothetical protein
LIFAIGFHRRRLGGRGNRWLPTQSGRTWRRPLHLLAAPLLVARQASVAVVSPPRRVPRQPLAPRRRRIIISAVPTTAAAWSSRHRQQQHSSSVVRAVVSHVAPDPPHRYWAAEHLWPPCKRSGTSTLAAVAPVRQSLTASQSTARRSCGRPCRPHRMNRMTTLRCLRHSRYIWSLSWCLEIGQ